MWKPCRRSNLVHVPNPSLPESPEMARFRFVRLSERTATLLLAAALSLVTAALVSRGIHWARLHPDEGIVERRALEEIGGRVVHRAVFPAGYYRLATVMDGIDRRAHGVSHWLSDWTQQEGADGTAPIYRETDLTATMRPRLRYRIREWNVALAALSTFLLFLLLRALYGGGWLAPALGSLLYAAHPFVIEHSHYAETDAALLLTEVLAFLLATLALRGRMPWLILVASLAAGFAISMKFSCLLFVGAMPVAAFVVARRRGWGAKGATALAAGALAALLAGYLVGTPMLLLAPRTYVELSRAERVRAFSENAVILDKLAGVPFANLVVKGRAMIDEAARLGWGWWLWALLCVPLWFSRRMRPNWAGVPLFGLTYAPFAFFAFPWFRQQEFLPMLPFLAATMALPLAAGPGGPPLSRSQSAPQPSPAWPARLLKTAVLAAVLCAVVSTVRDGIRVSSAFAEIETTAAAERWLALCGPRLGRFGFEPYARVGVSIARRPDTRPEEVVHRITKLEDYDADKWSRLSLDYFVRTPDRRGRSAFDPRTGRRFPVDQSRYDAILSDAVPLRSWRAAPDNRPKFSQLSLELYGRADPGPAVADVPVLPGAPFFVFGNSFGTRAMRAGADSPHVGPIEAVQLTPRKVTIAFDPLPAGARYYAVAMNFDATQPACVSWTRGFSPARATIPPSGAALFTSTRALDSFWRTTAESRVHTTLAGNDALCLVAVTADRALAEALLRRHGAPEAAVALGRNAGRGTPAEAEALLAAPDPTVAWDALAPACAAASSALGDAPVAPGISLGGLPLRIQDDFSRICLGPFDFGPRVRHPGSRAKLRRGFLWAEFPIVLEPGRYILRLFLANDRHLTASACGNDPGKVPLPGFDAIGATVMSAHATGWAPDGSLVVEMELVADHGGIPFVLGIAAESNITSVAASGITLRWHPADILASIASLAARPDPDESAGDNPAPIGPHSAQP